jgi:Holin of 3TMs, for gene-transfer release
MDFTSVSNAIRAVQPEASGLLKVLELIPGVGTVAGGVDMALSAFTSVTKALGLPADSQPDAVAAAIAADPQAALKMKQADLDYQLAVLKENHAATQAELAATNASLATVNATMVAELQGSKDEKWYQKAWRPACGFCVAVGALLSIAFVCGLFYRALTTESLTAANGSIIAVLNIMPLFAGAVATILAIPGAAVGITAWHKGMMQREQVTANGNGKGDDTPSVK